MDSATSRRRFSVRCGMFAYRMISPLSRSAPSIAASWLRTSLSCFCTACRRVRVVSCDCEAFSSGNASSCSFSSDSRRASDSRLRCRTPPRIWCRRFRYDSPTTAAPSRASSGVGAATPISRTRVFGGTVTEMRPRSTAGDARNPGAVASRAMTWSDRTSCASVSTVDGRGSRVSSSSSPGPCSCPMCSGTRGASTFTVDT
ncbi:hypothetical protein BJF79_42185 [Actinomadura sp. CNU-125]|uniref:hypothetical protein n=1 Tax=Actinomadura sp. CNU-125 TaxID=1904961 RepID=UPI000961BFD7|nr:hypothetical protein [Actinomadura sp. CNU-125]OLT27977.1 hypothetical protein BJF79_42185 [Actinomadura sp. CNU-125]